MIWTAIFLLLLALAVAIMTLVIDDMIDKIEAFFLGGFSCLLLLIGLPIANIIVILGDAIISLFVQVIKLICKYTELEKLWNKIKDKKIRR